MGTKVHCKSCLPGYYSMRDLNEDSSSSSWPLFYGDNTVTNGQYFNGFIPRTTIDDHPGYEKVALKQKMLEHETIFRNQVHELHRLYRIQRDMMEEVKRKDLRQRASIEPSSSSSLRGSQKPSEDAKKWHMGGFPMTNSAYGRTTILGVEVANSPMTCTIGNDTQHNQFPFKNGSSLKDREGLDSRPLKVRKKLFDLRRPAEEYADTEEGGNFEDNSTTSPKSSVKLIFDNQAGVKVPINASASDCCFRGSIGLADLNEPFRYEESVAPSHFDFHGHHSTNGDIKRMNQSAKSSAGQLGSIHDGFLLNSPIGSKVNERDRLSSFYEAGYDKSNLNSVSQALRQDKFPRINQVNQPSGLYPSVCSRQDLWRDNSHHGAEFLEKSRDLSHTFFGSPSFTGSRTHSASSLAKSKNDFTQKLTTFEPPFNSAAAVDISFQPFSQTQDEPFFGGKWQVDGSSRWNPGLESEGKVVNGFYHGSASGSKETQALLPSAGLDYLKYSKDDKVISDRSTNHGFGIFAKHKSCHEYSKPALNINLNEVVSTSPNELVMVEDLNMTRGKMKQEYHLPALPWLRPKPANDNKICSNYVPDFSNQLCRSRETVEDLNQPITITDTLAPSDCRVIEKNLNAESRNVQKILGFPIFATIAPKEEPTSLVSSSTVVNYAAEKKIVSTKRENIIIDINIECEPDEQTADEELTVEKPTKNTCLIDLNSCVSDCEDPPVPSFESKNNSVKVTLEIDLEAPVFLESEDDDAKAEKNVPEDASFPVSENNAEPIHDEVLQNAADTMLAISSSCPRVHISEASLAESLLWFVNAMSLCSVELEHVSCKESRAGVLAFPLQEFSKETDEFEAMVLRLVETKKEDFMPKPFIPEVPIEENGGTSNMLATRSRRGHSRRGRQRKDFQRDVLPGLTSLSRHEMTEDLQTFGGIMKATGHQWNSGLARRNGTRNSGGARGRRRVVVETVTTTVPNTVCAPLMPQPNDIKSGLEDRSLTGWGKTTRRPRRQRFPASNNPTIAST